MEIQSFVQALGSDFFAGVPDSLLRPLCDYLMDTYGIDERHHVVAANEGNCVGLAAGYHLATGKIPVVYMQNSGQGNALNPAASLLHPKVYGIPVLFVIGWRGEPNKKDEPQHVKQGEVTLSLLDTLDIPYLVLDADTKKESFLSSLSSLTSVFSRGGSCAVVVRKEALQYEHKRTYQNDYQLMREDVIRTITEFSGDDPIVSTTGKASRELFEIRAAAGQGHAFDFLTVGSMGHSSSIALGIATQKPERRVWCIDGDGSLLMHLGALPVLGSIKPKNMIHIVINNGAHETVGGLPTVANQIDVVGIALACGYAHAVKVETQETLRRALAEAKERQSLSLIEVCCALGSRENLGRPTTTPIENKQNFMAHLQN